MKQKIYVAKTIKTPYGNTCVLKRFVVPFRCLGRPMTKILECIYGEGSIVVGIY